MKLSGLVLPIIFIIAFQDAVIARHSRHSKHKVPHTVVKKDSINSVEKAYYLPIQSEIKQNTTELPFYKLVQHYYGRSNFLFRIILFLNLFFLSSAILLITLIFIKRLVKDYVEFRERKCQNRYRNYITEWIYSNKDTFVPASLLKELKDPILRDVFTTELLSLHGNLSGESAEQLERLFRKAGLDAYAVRKIHHPFWHVKAKGFKELSQMKIRSQNQLIERYLSSKNLMLRLEATLAWIQLNPDDPFSFYDDPEIQLTEWGQINSLIALKKIGSVPDFGRWIESPNKGVVIFSLKMAGIFKQFNTAELVTQRLYDKDPEVRREAIIALGRMELPVSNSSLKEIFPDEEITNKAEIIRSLILTEDQLNTPFFEEKLIHEREISIRILSARGLVMLGKGSAKILDAILPQADTSLQLVIMHAKDKRI